MVLHLLMFAMLLLIVRPIFSVRRYLKMLNIALELAPIPLIKNRMMNSTYNRSFAICNLHRQLATTYYPFVVFAMLFNTIIIWFMLSDHASLSDGYLLTYSIMMTMYGAAAFYFNPMPEWLCSWVRNLLITKATINLEEVNRWLEQKRIELDEATQANDKELIASVEHDIKFLIGMGELYMDDIEKLEKQQ